MFNKQNEKESINEIMKNRLEKLKKLQLKNKDPFEINKYDITIESNKIIENFDLYNNKEVVIAGRIMSKRGMGKVLFCDLKDETNKIQIYLNQKNLIDNIIDLKDLDIGDILGCSGKVFKTKVGEISINITKFEILAKSLRTLPEKWHGLKDTDIRYRKRYLDLIVNPNVRKTFEIRSKLIKNIRNYLEEKNFIEVETPILTTIAGGAIAKPFQTYHNSLNLKMYLRIATELHLKKLIIGGFNRVYEIGRIFRNEGMSYKHNPEFTTIELYQTYVDYKYMIALTENMIKNIVFKTLNTYNITYKNDIINLEKKWQKITMIDAINKYCGLNLDFHNAKEIGKKMNIDTNNSNGNIINTIFEKHVESNLIEPTFILDYPIEVSPLAKKKKNNHLLTERFELFIAGRELANAFSELNDPIEQKERFLKQNNTSNIDENCVLDQDFIEALEYGMPPTGGLGIGIDRLVMLLTNSYSIRDVLLFPTMK